MKRLSKISFKDIDEDRRLKGNIIEDNAVFVKVECENNIYEIGKVRDYCIKTPKDKVKGDSNAQNNDKNNNNN